MASSVSNNKPMLQEPDRSGIVATTDSVTEPQRVAQGQSTVVGWHYSAAQICDEDTWKRKTESDLANLQNEGSSDFPIIATARLGSQSTYLHGLELKSKYLIDLYKSCASSVPGASISTDRISFQEPFLPLCLYMDQMLSASSNENCLPQHQAELKALVELYNRWIKPSHDAFQEMFNDGIAAFQDLKALFRPGELIFTKDSLDEPQLHRVWTSEDGSTDLRPNINMVRGEKNFSFHGWSLQWDSSTRRFKRSARVFKLAYFLGTRRITLLPFVPLAYQFPNNEARGRFLKDLETRGRLWKSLVSGLPVCRKHSGLALLLRHKNPALNSSNRVNLNDRVIVDSEGPTQYGDPEIPKSGSEIHWYGDFNGCDINGIINVGTFPGESEPSSLGDDENLNSVRPEEEFTTLQARLCPSNLKCYSPSSRTWFSASVSRLSEIKWNDSAWEHLVLEQKIKDTIMTLVEQHRARSNNEVVGDVIEGKGNGLVIALHGPPGVGKTLTAESVAEITERPLYAINVGEVTSEEHVRTRLQEIFADATKWNAVLLLDEADVVLEKRSFEDIRRNGTVSIFLRMLEYYQGIIFLTTNRLQHIDEAFYSRIHLAYEYKELTVDQKRTIWSNFIDQLPEEEYIAKSELKDSLSTLKNLSLNGRQIRNVLFTARSLARGESGPGGLRYEHVQKMIEHTRGFQRYFSDGQERRREGLGTTATSGRRWDSRNAF